MPISPRAVDQQAEWSAPPNEPPVTRFALNAMAFVLLMVDRLTCAVVGHWTPKSVRYDWTVAELYTCPRCHRVAPRGRWQ